MTTFIRRATLWRRVLTLAGLLVGLILMHGVGLGHGPPPMTHVTDAPAHAALEQPGTSGHVPTGLPPGGADHSQSSGHTEWAQMCLAVLGAVAIASLALLRLSEDDSRAPRRSRYHGTRQMARITRPRDGPSLHQLCVMRV
ncbi:DUF6153 family protein [Serinicoccus sp. LYQ131]|uniref:DUF6153 family protein n=1 Tax=Serinicoccus sp. LYQ131 TaxID=3378797 RepID=UPI003853B9FF